jgi:hypothetical protein
MVPYEPIQEPEGIAAPPVCCGRPEDQAVVARHLDALRSVIAQPKRYPGHQHDYGVVYVGGGKYWPGIAVGCHLLRRLGYSGPIQVWHGHRANDEPVRPDDVAGLDVEIVNALEVARTSRPRILRGWESKLHALVQVPFRRVLYLDADAYCVDNPEPYFSLLDDAPFRFWIDLPVTEPNVKWPKAWPAGSNGVPQIQGGQLFIDREAAWDMMVATWWMNMHSDYYYRHMFGDQDTWRVALAATGCPWRDLGKAAWQSPAFVCSAGGKPLVVHRCRGKLYRVRDIPTNRRCYSGPNYSLPRESEVWDLMAQLARDDNDPTTIFSHIYQVGLWGGGSGAGSTPYEMQPYLEAVAALATVGIWQTATDAGCGDCRVLLALAARYPWRRLYGVDCVRSVFPQAIPDRVTLSVGDITDISQLPPADVLLVKDVLHHWPTATIRQWLREVIQAGRWRWLVCTQDRAQRAEDCHLGGYRGLDPAMSPLSEFGPWHVIAYLHKAICIRRL